ARATERPAALMLEEAGEVLAEEFLFEADLRIPIAALKELAGEVMQRDRLITVPFHLMRKADELLAIQHVLIRRARVAQFAHLGSRRRAIIRCRTARDVVALPQAGIVERLQQQRLPPWVVEFPKRLDYDQQYIMFFAGQHGWAKA